LGELSAIPDFDIELTGFDVDEVASLNPAEVVEEDDFDVDDALADIDEPVTKLGDIILLGRHQLMCGDSTKMMDVDMLMDGVKVDMVFTDPPYNVNYNPEKRHTHLSPKRIEKPLGTIQNDKMAPAQFRDFLDNVYSCINGVLKEGRAIYICHADKEGHHFRSAFVSQPWLLKSCIIWKKTVLVFGRGDYHWMHEPILYGWKEGDSHLWEGDRKQTTVWEFPSDHYNKAESDTKGKYVHPTQKPVALVVRAIKNSSRLEDVVLDVFIGSGSTLIACEQTNRICYGMELDEKYCDVIVKRWEEFTNQKAIRPKQ